MGFRKLLTVAIMAGMVPLAIPVIGTAATNILFILDGSNSMWGKVDGKSKIQSAQSVMASLIKELPKDTNVGLMAYGHRSKDSCDDIQIVSAIGQDDAKVLVNKIYSLQPKGKTPIGGALKASLSAFSKHLGENNHVVLISDGIETCQADPCAASKALAEANIQARVHVVGFGVSEKEREKLMCIPRMGKGQYFSAANAAELKSAVVKVQKVAQKAPPAKPKSNVFLFDEFDGEKLKDHWEVLNPDPDSFIVENGKLTVIGNTAAKLKTGKVKNIFRFKNPLPKGDWVATMKFNMGYQTGREAAFFGVYNDKANYITGITYSWSYYEGIRGARMYLGGEKNTRGNLKSFYRVLWGGAGGKPFTMEKPPNPFILRLTKKGRTYIPAVLTQGIPKAKWVEHERFTVLRQKGNLAFGIYQGQKVSNETTMMIDWVKIETLE